MQAVKNEVITLKISEVLAGLKDQPLANFSNPPEVPEDAKIVGEVPAELRPLFAFWRNTVDQLMVLRAKIDQESDPTVFKPLIKEVESLLDSTEIIGKIFWHDLEIAFEVEGTGGQIGVANNWQVWLKKEEEECDCPIHRALRQKTGSNSPDIIGMILATAIADEVLSRVRG